MRTAFEMNLRAILGDIKRAQTMGEVHCHLLKLQHHLDFHIITDASIWTESDFYAAAVQQGCDDMSEAQLKAAIRALRVLDLRYPSFINLNKAVQTALLSEGLQDEVQQQ